MRIHRTMMLGAGLTFLLAGSSSAQQPAPGGLGGLTAMLSQAGALMYLRDEGVQKELNLSSEQKEKVAESLKKFQGKFQELITLPEAERQAKLAEMAKQAGEESKKLKTNVLKHEQTKRLREIELQQGGLVSLATDAEAQKALKMTPEQKEKIKTLNEDQAKEIQELFQAMQQNPKSAKEIQAKIPTLRKEGLEKGVAMLSDDQQKHWKEMLGTPFEMKPIFRPKN